jgi:hypothetical protein
MRLEHGPDVVEAEEIDRLPAPTRLSNLGIRAAPRRQKIPGA